MKALEQGQPARPRCAARRCRGAALAVAAAAALAAGHGAVGAEPPPRAEPEARAGSVDGPPAALPEAAAAEGRVAGAVRRGVRRAEAALHRAESALPRLLGRPGPSTPQAATDAPDAQTPAAVAYPHRHARLPHERVGARAAIALRHAADGLRGLAQFGRASFYADLLHGRRTSSGEPYDRHALTAAHRTLPLGTLVHVTNLRNQRTVTVRVNDRGPFTENRVIDLSKAAAQQLGYVPNGTAPVRLRVVDAAAEAEGSPAGQPVRGQPAAVVDEDSPTSSR